MSDYGFGVDDGEQGELQAPNPQGPKWFRERMDEVSVELKALRERNESLEKAQRQTQVAEALTAQGYAPTAAQLFTGKPEELTDWLGTYGAALAKADGSAVEQGQGAQGTPQTVISPESQAAMQQMAAAGQDGAAALAGDEQLAARISMAKDEAELNAILKGEGSKYV